MTVATIKFSQFATGNLTNTTNQIVGVTSDMGGANFQIPFPFVWTTATRPVDPPSGLEGYNSSLGQIEYWNGGAWIQLAAGGSGSVNLGAINELAWYAANGTAVSGLMTTASSVLLTNALGVPAWSAGVANSILTANGSGLPAWSTTLPAGLTLPQPIIQQPNIIGVTDGSNAPAGSVGEYIYSSILEGSAVPISNNATTTVTMINLTPGDWNISGSVTSNPAGAYTSSFMSAGISLTNNAFGTVGAENNITQSPATISSILGSTLCVGIMRLSITVNTPVYLVTQINFAGTTMSAYGFIGARRVR